MGHCAGQEQSRQQETGGQQHCKYSFFHHKNRALSEGTGLSLCRKICIHYIGRDGKMQEPEGYFMRNWDLAGPV